MKFWAAVCLTFLVSISTRADSDPKAVVEPLKIGEDTFYTDVSKFNGRMNCQKRTGRADFRTIRSFNQ